MADHQRARIHSAMIEVVTERGYEAVTLRELASLAGVSTRAFYKHYASKEECFLRTHELIVRRVVRRMVAAQAGGLAWHKRLRATFDVFFEEMAQDPRAARLILVDAYCVGPAAHEQLRRADHTFEARFKSCFDRDPSGAEIPPILIKAIAAGMTSIARSRLVTNREAELPELGNDLTAWALVLHAGAPDLLTELDRQQKRGTLLAPSLAPSSKAEASARTPTAGVRALLLTAVAKLAASEGYEDLTVRRIRQAAGASPRSFSANFEGVEDCFITAFEEIAREALTEARAAHAAAKTWEQGIEQAVATICARVSRDPLFAQVCFDKVLTPGVEGARRLASLIEETAESLEVGALPNGVATETSVGASWSLIQQCLADHLPGHAIRLSPFIGHLIQSRNRSFA